MKIKELLGRKIKQYRILKGYTQEEFSELLNISQRTLSGIECGKNFLSSTTMDKILEVLNIKADDLFYLDYLKNEKEMIEELRTDIQNLKSNPEKLRIVYKIVKAVIKD